jgi:uncharacterized protein (TIGR02594 family)
MTQALIEIARGYIGVAEFPGRKSNPAVERFFEAAGHPGLTDDVPWCAAFAGAVLAEAGFKPSGSLMARSYATWGLRVPLADARPGDIVVMERGAPPSGHVAFFVGWEADRVRVVGGNQGDQVTETTFPAARVIAIRRADRAAATGRATLRQGDRGPMVADLQGQLAALRYFAGRADGQFGPLTRAAVMAFQADTGIEADGIVGPQTWAAMRNAPPRPERDIDAAELRRQGSETVRNSDAIDVVAGAGGVAGVVQIGREVAGAAAEAEGILATLTRVVMQNWPVLLVIGAVLIVLALSGRIRAARVRDARTGAHVGR